MRHSEVALTAANVLLGTAVGAGLNQSLFVLPGWFESPPESLIAASQNKKVRTFWIPLQVGAAVSLGAAFALNRHGGRQRLLGAALGLYAVTWLSTAAYFAPEIIRLGRNAGQLPASEVARRGRRWLNLTWARQAALGAAWLLVTAAARRRGGLRT